MGTAITTAFAFTSVFILLPLYIFILCKGVQRCRQHRSSASMSHIDVFTYHMVIVELLSVPGSILISVGAYTQLMWLTQMGITILCMNYAGQLLFHILTCGERYLAVVYPITYRKLKKEKGIQIRNIIIGCFWLLCITWGATLLVHTNKSFQFTLLSFTVLALVFISKLNLSILWVLVRFSPRGEGRRRQQCDRSKLKVLLITTAILGALVLKNIWTILSIAVLDMNHIEEVKRCGLAISIIWINIPSSLVLPLLFLQKERKKSKNAANKVISQ